MDDIVNNWTNLSWWVNHIPAAIVAFSIGAVFKYTPKVVITLITRSKIRELNKIRRRRFNYSAVNYEITKSHTLMLLFSGLCIYYLYIFSNTPSSQGTIVVLIKSLPLYIVEMMYLLQRNFTKNLIERVGKLSHA
ncbi:hypothetical protein [Pseudoalteromonas rubra]|uniref:hypothetical protein n=1 Tax=Pseudoalteromonas rubra TaxID=43658 RepID=UPI000F7A195A|nr:hypothetical protein [Pseudoalteromonas rubra]